jgi:hypothetical protein
MAKYCRICARKTLSNEQIFGVFVAALNANGELINTSYRAKRITNPLCARAVLGAFEAA